jgi:hypothetical protein
MSLRRCTVDLKSIDSEEINKAKKRLSKKKYYGPSGLVGRRTPTIGSR